MESRVFHVQIVIQYFQMDVTMEAKEMANVNVSVVMVGKRVPNVPKHLRD
jgi:hypothetical protein